MTGEVKAITIILVVLIVTIGGCLGNTIHQEEITRQLVIKGGCGK